MKITVQVNLTLIPYLKTKEVHVMSLIMKDQDNDLAT